MKRASRSKVVGAALALVGVACGPPAGTARGPAPAAAAQASGGGPADTLACAPAPATPLVLVPQVGWRGVELAPTEDGRLVLVDSDGSAQVWDLATAELRGAVAALRDAGPVEAAVDRGRRRALRPDGRALATATASGEVILRDLATGIAGTARPPGKSIERLVWTGDGRWLVMADAGATDLVAADGRRRSVQASLEDPDGALSADGARMIAADGGVWDTASARRLWALPREVGVRGGRGDRRATPGRGTMSPDGQWVALPAPRSVLLLDGATGAQRGEIAIEATAQHLRFDPSGRTLAVGDADGVYLVDLTARRTLATIPASEWRPHARDAGRALRAVVAPEFSPDGKTVAVIQQRYQGYDRTLAVAFVRASTGQVLLSVPFGNGADQMRWTRDGRRLVILGDELHILDVGRSLERAAGSSEATRNAMGALDVGMSSLPSIHRGLVVRDVAWSADGTALAMTTSRGDGGEATGAGVRVWDLRGGTVRASIEARVRPRAGRDSEATWEDEVYRPQAGREAAAYDKVVWSPDGQLLALVRRDGIELWDGRAPDAARTLDDDVRGTERSVAFSPDGHVLVTAAQGTGELRLWDPRSGARLRTIPLGDDHPTALAFSPDGTQIAVAASAGKGLLRLIDARSGATLHVDPSRDDQTIREIYYGPRGLAIVGMTGGGRVELFGTETDAPGRILAADVARGSTAALSPDGNLLVSGDRDLRVSDLRTGAVARDIPGGGGEVRALRFAPGGQLAVARADRVDLYRMSDGATVHLRLLESTGRGAVGVEYTDGGLFAGDPAAFGLLRFRSDGLLGSAPLERVDRARELLRPTLGLDFVRGCPLEGPR